MNAPVYNVNDVVYLRESAALGFLEAVKIATIREHNGYWVYTIKTTPSQPQSPDLYGDRTSIVSGALLYFSESELIDQCTALALAEQRAQAVLDSVKAKRAKNCP